METSAPSGRTKRLFHTKSIATIDAIEHVLNVANSYLAYGTAISSAIGDYSYHYAKSVVKIIPINKGKKGVKKKFTVLILL
jgi:hypothetical protein